MRRRLRGGEPTVDVFLQLDDPWSGLLAQVMPQVGQRYRVRLEWHVCEAADDDFQPRPDLLAAYAVEDARLLARAMRLRFLDCADVPPADQRRALLRALAADADKPWFGETLCAALTAYWRGDAEAAQRITRGAGDDDGPAAAMLAEGKRRLRAGGHYNSAMLGFEGEWYWGLDRLPYLCARLEALGLAQEPAGRKQGDCPPVTRFTRFADEGARGGNAGAGRTLTLFFSFRSPYSWLALARIGDFIAAHGLALELRPVLPMVTRGLPVPDDKRRYIVSDAAREARRHGIPFGRICDPLGQGVENCCALMPYAESHGRGLAFAQHAMRAAWAEGRSLAAARSLQRVVEAAGLDWAGAREALADEAWRGLVEHNRRAMTERGIWGVPAFTIGDLVLWGQDRLWLLAAALADDAGP